MTILDDKHVKIENAMILWDSVTKPEQGENGVRYKLKLGLQGNNPAIAELNQLAGSCLNESKWKGSFPPGANWAINQINPGQYLDLLPGGVTINPSTTRPVEIWDDSGNKIDPMQYPNFIYTGQIVHVIVHCWDYDNKQKGIATGLDGVQVQVKVAAPRQNFGGESYDCAGAFGTPAPGAMPPVAGTPAPGAMPPVAGTPAHVGSPPVGAPAHVGSPPVGAPAPNANWMPPA